ncbi:unnamed protein product [Gongylonema pulchrum]|uniref:Uncharacterized protein n=1 Tax=Gongylonema pulchrum TaxID=637853 RepID=A0A3P7NYS3_9BILA|nr:unnamed protein product [Gongylonema pulchrum]
MGVRSKTVHTLRAQLLRTSLLQRRHLLACVYQRYSALGSYCTWITSALMFTL